MAQKTDSIPKVPKVNVSKTTFDILFRNIMDGTWKTGEKIPSENELKNSLMVSRHTIRSAIANLNMLGILETRQGDGNYVRETGIGLYIDFLIPYLMINTANVSQIIEFREAIEISVARLAARRATEENLEDIRQRHATAAVITRPLTRRSIWNFTVPLPARRRTTCSSSR